MLTQYPRMTPFLKPHCDHISAATSRRRWSPGRPYWPCIRILNISTIIQQHQYSLYYVCINDNEPGLANIAFAAPAIAPAAAISFRESSGYGEMTRFEKAYDAKRRLLTPAMPSKGDSMPDAYVSILVLTLSQCAPLYNATKPSFRIVWSRTSIGPFLTSFRLATHSVRPFVSTTHKHAL